MIEEIKGGRFFQSEWVIFERLPPAPKTERFRMSTIEGNELGVIKWHGAWRKYCSFIEKDTIFDAKCHKDITEFLEMLMGERKKKKYQCTDCARKTANDEEGGKTCKWCKTGVMRRRR